MSEIKEQSKTTRPINPIKPDPEPRFITDRLDDLNYAAAEQMLKIVYMNLGLELTPAIIEKKVKEMNANAIKGNKPASTFLLEDLKELLNHAREERNQANRDMTGPGASEPKQTNLDLKY
jgi:hypothetical protein